MFPVKITRGVSVLIIFELKLFAKNENGTPLMGVTFT